MKRTIIEAEDLKDGRVSIIGFENVATADDIIKEFGVNAYKKYNKSEYYYIRAVNTSGDKIDKIFIFQRINAIRVFDFCTIEPGLNFSKKAFGEIISKMKACGENLMRARKQAAKEEKKKGKKRRIIRIEI